MRIIAGGLEHPRVQDLLEAHLRSSQSHSPPGSVHALNLDALRHPSIRFWTAWDGEDLMGCGALKTLTPAHGELKSMRTADAHLRKGVARQMLDHIEAEARALGLRQISLETGSHAPFAAARALYARAGFVECGPFAGYVLDPYSTFMTKHLL
ncbi:GNAT family N-acetyltransferase [Rhodoferax sp. TH121]|uniref:GNAT family N-acetyltransferase n=1 Tax=Rhodoferax sp. TH121 TaxID=2022803 RepID=UPI000B974E24|nr:GNAT family N-acetyltransferase [Rhodoferax sp. TH121]OYQ41811.1 GNAT family N-acetyltransferase [Rhodoferax sp. TH121]